MAFTKSLSLADHLHPYLESYHKEGRSISALASRLFTEYFTGASGICGTALTAGTAGTGMTNGANGAYGAAGEEEKAMAGRMAGIRYSLIQQDLDRVRAELDAIEQELNQATTTFRAAAEQRNARRHEQDALLREEIGREFADIAANGTTLAAGANPGARAGAAEGASADMGAGAGAGSGTDMGANPDPASRKKAAARYRAWGRGLHLEGADPISIINHRITAIATRTGRSSAEVRGALNRHLPGIEEVV